MNIPKGIVLLKNLFFQTSDNDPAFFLLLFLKSFFHEGIKNTVKMITINIKKAIHPKIHLQPIIGNKICTGKVEKTKPIESTINIHALALC